MSVKSIVKSIFYLLKHNFYWRLCLIILLIVLIVSSVLQWMLFPTENLAGSVQLVNTSLIRQGKTIHQDFWSKEVPLVFYLNSLAFSIFGESVISAKLAGIAIYCLMCVGFYVYFRGFPRLSRSAIIIFTLISAYLTLFTLIQAKWVAYSISSLALIVYLTNFHYHGNKSDTLLMVSGIITGFAILAKLNCGGYVLCAIGLGLLNDLLIYQSEQNKVSWHKTKRLIYFCLPAIACLGLYLISNFNHLSELIDQVIVFPSQGLEQHRIISLAYRNDSPYELFKDFVPIYLTVVFPLIWFHLQLVRVAKTLKLRQFLPLALGIIILPLLLIAELQYPNLLPKFFVLPLTGVIACQLFVQPIKTPQFTMISWWRSSARPTQRCCPAAPKPF